MMTRESIISIDNVSKQRIKGIENLFKKFKRFLNIYFPQKKLQKVGVRLSIQ